MEHEIYNPEEPAELRTEWVPLRKGGVWVRELTAADMAMIAEKTTRPGFDPRGPGQDRGGLVLYQIMHACWKGPEPTAARVFGDTDLARVGRLPSQDMEAILAAVNRTCGKGEAEEQALRDFTKAPEGPSSSD